MVHVTTLNKEQADDFLKKYLQNNIEITRIAKDDEDGIYFVDLTSGKKGNKVNTSWQFRPYVTETDTLLGSRNLGLCFGKYLKPGTNCRYDFYGFTDTLLARASAATWKAIQEWEKVNPKDFVWNDIAYPEQEEKYKTKGSKISEFDKETAYDGDLYLYQSGKLLYMGNTIPEPPKLSLFKRVRNWFFK